METREGYKETKIGWIPEDWELRKTNDVLQFMTDYVANGSFQSLRENVIVYDNENYAIYVRLVDLRAGLGHDKQKYVDQASYDFLSKSSLCGNEILMANIGANVGEVFLMPLIKKPATLAPNMILMKSRENYVDNKYLYCFLKSDIGLIELNRVISGSGHPKINKTELKTVNIPLPPLPEQQKIASILTTVDDKISSIDQQIQQTEQLKKGLMEKLLTEGIGHTEFKETEIGRIPKGWDVVRFGEVFNLKSGMFLSKNKVVSGDYPVYGGNGITNYHNEYLFKNSQLVIGRVGAKCGCVCISEPFSWITDNALHIHSKIIDFDFQYMFYLLTKIDLNNYANKNAQPVISNKKIYSIRVAFPPQSEQKQIATILTTVDDKIDILQSKKASYTTLKKGLMAQLLTGQMRVKI